MLQEIERYTVKSFVESKVTTENPVQTALQGGIGAMAEAIALRQASSETLSQREIAQGITPTIIQEDPHQLIWETDADFSDGDPLESERAMIKLGVEDGTIQMVFGIVPNYLNGQLKSIVTEQQVFFTWQENGEIAVSGKNVNPIDYANHMNRIVAHVRGSLHDHTATVQAFPGSNFTQK